MNSRMVKTQDLFECENELLKSFFDSYEYPWEILARIKSFIKEFIDNGAKGFKEISKGVFVGENVKIHNSAVIDAPTIICDETEIRPGAYIRGNVIIGRKCVIGNSSELKESILLDYVQVPHYNYVGNSILGNHSHMGASSICSNLKSDGKNIVVHGIIEYQTGLRKMGAILGDYADIGCGSVLNPGTIIGKNTSVYPLTMVRGVIPSGCIVKSMENIVERR